MTQPMHDDKQEFFIGYRPTPPRLSRFLRRSVMIGLTIVLVFAFLTPLAQPDPGAGVWRDDQFLSLRGMLYPRPYPILLTNDGPVLLVAEGKHAFHADPGDLTVTGTTLVRANLRLLEVTSFQHRNPSESSLTPALSSLAHTFRGEIIDPKCFAGAMKPGSGKPHKACASLCLRGGIPPAFRSADHPGHLYLLLTRDGRAIEGPDLDLLLPFVADTVEVRGAPTLLHGLPALLIDLATPAASLRNRARHRRIQMSGEPFVNLPRRQRVPPRLPRRQPAGAAPDRL